MSKLKSSYKILPGENLVIECHSGILEASNYIDFKKKLIIDSLFKANMNHFIHYKNVVFKTSASDIALFVDFVKKNVQFLGHRKIALITDTPNQVVSTTMYKMMTESSNQTAEVFSTNISALKWLSIPNSKHEELTSIILGLIPE